MTEVVVPDTTEVLDELSNAIQKQHDKQEKKERVRRYCCGCCE